MQSPSRCNKRIGRYSPANNMVSCTTYRAENGKLGNMEVVENNGTAFEPKKCFYQKVAVGMENPKMQSPSWCDKRTGRYGRQNARFHTLRIGPRMEIWGTSKLAKTMVLAFAPTQCLHLKVAVGMENPKMQ